MNESSIVAPRNGRNSIVGGVARKLLDGKHVTGNGVNPVLTSYAGECHVTIMMRGIT